MCHPPRAVLANLNGTWVNEASPAVLRPAPTTKYGGRCVCAPDPLLPDPHCILCLCDTELIGNNTLPPAAQASSAAATVSQRVTKLEAGCTPFVTTL
jgi:hypothetical protein